MANNDIKQRIVLEGEKEYSNALKEAQRNLKVLRSELKAETAELGKNATAQDTLRVKTENLKKQIAEQEKIVKTYETALKEVKEKYGDNEEAVAKWEIKLNDARTALANLKNGLSDTDTGIKQTTTDFNTGVTAAKSFADSLQEVASVGSSISGALESAFSGIVGVISDAISGIWTQVVDVAAKADNWADLASFFSTSATNVQRWDNAMKGANGDLGTISSLISKLKYGGKTDDIAQYFGISAENYTDDLVYFYDVMNEMFGRKDAMKAAGTWNEAMSSIFGAKKVQEVDGILSDWETIQEGLTTFDVNQGGYGLTDEEIQDMATLSDKVATLKASWESLRDMATVKLFGSLAMDITGNMQELLDAFRDYFGAEDDAEREEALGRIKENVKAIFETIGKAIQDGIELLGEMTEEFKNSDDPTMQAIGGVLDGLVDALAWFADPKNWDTVRTFFEGLFAIWATSNVTSVIGNMMSFGVNLGNIATKLLGLGNSGTGTGTPTYSGDGSNQTTTNGGSPLAAPSGGSNSGNTGSGTGTGKSWWATLLDNMVNGMGTMFVLDQYEELKHKVDGFTEGLTEEEAKKKITMHDFNLGTDEEYEQFLKEIQGDTTGTHGGRSFGELGFWDTFWDLINIDVPADSWNSTDDNESSSNDENLAGAIKGLPSNLKDAMGGVKVYMDSTEVGQLVAPTVSQWLYGAVMGK